MHTQSKFRTQIWLFLIFSVVFIAAGFLSDYFFIRQKENYVNIIRKVSEVISEKEKIIEKELENIFSDYQSGGINALFENKDRKKLAGEGITLLFYRNDTLKYWSDNNVIAENILNHSVFDSAFAEVGNSWYRILGKNKNGCTGIGLYLVRNNYRYENDFLKNQYQKDLPLAAQVKLVKPKNEYPVFSSGGEYLFSLDFGKIHERTDAETVVVLLSFLLGFLSLAAVLFWHHRWLFGYHRKRWLFVGGFIFDLLLLRFLMLFFRFPSAVYDSRIFSPVYFASSDIFPSMGDLILNSVVFLICAGFFYKNFHLRISSFSKTKKFLRIVLSLFLVLITAVLFYYLFQLLKSIVVDSVIPYTLNNIFNLNLLSLAGFLCIASLIISYFLVTSKLLYAACELTGKKQFFIIFFLVVIAGGIVVFTVKNISPVILIALIVYLAGLWFFRQKPGQSGTLSRIIFALFFFSLLTTYILHEANDFKEKEKRKSLARRLSESHDPVAEYLYEKAEKQIREDTLLIEMIKKIPQNHGEVADYIQKKYFKGYWDKYKIQITLCTPDDSLAVMPAGAVHCHTFFAEKIKLYGKPASSGNLYMLNFGTGGTSYISQIRFTDDTPLACDVYIEMSSKFINKGLGYPELLIDKKIFLNTDVSVYSYARYNNHELVDAYGKYYYSILLDTVKLNPGEMLFTENLGYNHLLYKPDKTSLLIISLKKGDLLEKIAPFSLLFMFFSLYVLLFLLVYNFPYKKKLVEFNFKNRLQAAMVSVIFISFILIGVSMAVYIQQLNKNKNIDTLSEKTLSILMELQGKLSEYDILSAEQEKYMEKYLRKFSDVFFTDINLFDPEGNLLSTSRPQVYEEGLISRKMNPIAYAELILHKKTIFIHSENIGNLSFFSAYMPFYNEKNKLVAYLNLPYFARENELKQQLSAFMMTYINIYLFLIAVATIIALIIAGRMTRPLKEIREKIGKVQLGGKNEKITWTRQNDEIGSLVNEYNRMIDELALSAELLAKSERESAWREMAKQVAHEIKNPLTPMKLSVQYLEKAWQEKAPDWEQRLKKFSNTLIEQIDTLSAIASAFSDFAKMPYSEMKKTDLNEIIPTVISTFSGENISIVFNADVSEKRLVLADKKQIIRALNNLITNAIQAIDNRKDGRIEVNVERKNEKYIVSVKDNGPGISDEQKLRIFMPNFSTKTDGMGLGLAIVKSIIEGHGGTIWFESKYGEGATFFFELPVYEG